MYQQDTTEQQQLLETSIERLQQVNYDIAKLTVEKEQLTKDIIAALGHQKEGERTYDVGIYKVKAKTPYIYSLDTKLYKAGEVYLPSEFDPVKQSTAYTVDKKLFDRYYSTSPADVREALIQLITIKPGKASVSVGVVS